MLYLCVFLLFFLGVLLYSLQNKTTGLITSIMTIILIGISIFRYGSGTDYFGYLYHYNNNPNSISKAIQYESHMDIGYRVLMGLFKSINIEYIGFVAIISLFMILTYYWCIYKESNNKILSLFIFYSVYYSIYVNSAFRQGIAMTIFLIAFYKYLKQKKKIKYMLMIVLGATFHKSILVALCIPFCIRFKKYFFKQKIVSFILVGSSLGLGLIGMDKLVVYILNALGIYVEVTGINIFAILLRVLCLIVIVYLAYVNRYKLNEFDKTQVYLYILGITIYFMCSKITILSRLTEYFMVIEIILIPNLMSYSKNNINKLYMIIIALIFYSIIFIKDVKSFTYQGLYYEKDIIKYPYITIFNKEDIFKHRVIQYEIEN